MAAEKLWSCEWCWHRLNEMCFSNLWVWFLEDSYNHRWCFENMFWFSPRSWGNNQFWLIFFKSEGVKPPDVFWESPFPTVGKVPCFFSNLVIQTNRILFGDPFECMQFFGNICWINNSGVRFDHVRFYCLRFWMLSAMMAHCYSKTRFVLRYPTISQQISPYLWNIHHYKVGSYQS